MWRIVESQEDSDQLEDLNYEKVNNFKYLGVTLSTKNDWSKEISILKILLRFELEYSKILQKNEISITYH